MQILTFLGFTILVALISYLATRKTAEDSSDGYFLGGRSLTAGVIAGSVRLRSPSLPRAPAMRARMKVPSGWIAPWSTAVP